ncbi:CPBP family intramembrane metalloprotease [Candidatus Amoebophilus asiaticus]|nr:CPBP family intramembrane metalloprotease [Candidatus Amoebophilus asiaticus]
MNFEKIIRLFISQRKELILFLLIAFFLVWLSPFIIYFDLGPGTDSNWSGTAWKNILGILVGISPALGAIVVTLVSGRSLKTLGFVGGRFWVYLICWLLPFLIIALFTIILIPLGQNAEFSMARLIDDYDGKLPYYASSIPLYIAYIMIVPTIITSIMVIGEEIGWRGYLLPALEARLGRKIALPLHGAIWGLWHVPIVLLFGLGDFGGNYVFGITWYILFCTVLGYLSGWLYHLSGKTVYAAALFHGAYNVKSQIVDPFLLGQSSLMVDYGIIFMIVLGFTIIAWLLIPQPWSFNWKNRKQNEALNNSVLQTQ